jgi:multidrug resistance efflux pump
MMPRLRRLIKTRRAVAVLAILTVCCIGVFGWVHSGKKGPTVSSFQVQRAEFVDSLQFRGDVKALKSITISAPPDVGTLQIVKVAANGSAVKRGDVVVEFDPSKTKTDLETDRSLLKSAQAETDQSQAQGRLTEEEDTTAVMKARYEVEVAKLDAGKEEIVSQIEGAEAKLKVADAEQALREAEEKLKADRAKNAATIGGHRSATSKARFDQERADRALASMVLKAPSDGNISLVSVWHDGSEGPFKPGERAWPGSPIAELPDPGSLRIVAHVDETERGRLSVSEPVTVQLDAIADRQFTGKIERIGTIATSDFSAGWPIPRNFTLEIVLDQKDPRLKPGMTSQITVIVERVPNAISIPVHASFLKSGRTVAYVWNGSKFEERAIQIERRSRDLALVGSGLKPGDTIAMKDPELKQ